MMSPGDLSRMLKARCRRKKAVSYSVPQEWQQCQPQEACSLELPPMIQSHSGLYGSVKHAHTSSWHLQTPLPARYHQ